MSRHRRLEKSEKSAYVAIMFIGLASIFASLIVKPELQHANELIWAFSTVVICISIYALYADYRFGKWLEARDYFLSAIKGYYFYERSLEQCLKNGTAYCLAMLVGDFTLPIGELILCALQKQKQNQDPLIYFRKLQKDKEHSYHEVYIYFKYENEFWLYRVDSVELDQYSLGSVGKRPLRERLFTKKSYWDFSEAEKHAIEQCKWPDKSYLRPIEQYGYYESDAEFEYAVKLLLPMIEL